MAKPHGKLKKGKARKGRAPKKVRGAEKTASLIGRGKEDPYRTPIQRDAPLKVRAAAKHRGAELNPITMMTVGSLANPPRASGRYDGIVRQIVSRLHVGASDSEVVATVVGKLRKDAPPRLREVVSQAAVRIHHENQGLYDDVMRGGARRPTKNPGSCPVCGGPGWGAGEICMGCVRARAATVARHGRCACGKKRIPGAEVQHLGRAWTPCERCLGAIPGSQRDVPRGERTRKNPRGGLIRVRRGPAEAAAHVEGYEENRRGCERFHDSPAVVDRVMDYDDGKKELTEKVVFALGVGEVNFNVVRDQAGNEVEIPKQRMSSLYSVPYRSSSKAGQQFTHDPREDGGKPPLEVCDAVTHIRSHLGDYEVTDYIRERRA